MVSFSFFFTLGVWYLQQQSELPELSVYWPLLVLVLLLPEIDRTALRLLRGALILSCAALLGFSYATWMAQTHLADTLPDAWQGQNISLTGIVAEMPRTHEHGLRFSFDVESVQTETAHVPKRIQLATYDGDSSSPMDTRSEQRSHHRVRCRPGTGGRRTN